MAEKTNFIQVQGPLFFLPEGQEDKRLCDSLPRFGLSTCGEADPVSTNRRSNSG
jgi:hypothetical protein